MLGPDAPICMSAMLLAGAKYSTATAFSIHCKRLQTPNKQGDDGWKSVMYAGARVDGTAVC